MDNLLRLRHLRYRQTPKLLKRVKAHAIRRELSTFVLAVLLKTWRFSDDKNLKVDVHPICPFLYLSQPIGNSLFERVTHYFSLKILLFPIPINNIGNDAVNHIIKEGLAQEAIVMGNDIFHIEHTHYVGYEIRCFCQWRRQPFALNGYGQLRIMVL